MKITKNITLEVNRVSDFKLYEVRQWDNESRVFNVTLVNDSVPVTIPNGAAVTADAVVGDVIVAQDESLTVTNSVIALELTENMLSLPGILSVDIKVTESDELLTAATVRFYVGQSVINDDSRFEPAGQTWAEQLALKEAVANKVTSMSSGSTDTQYPSAKCVFDALNPYLDYVVVSQAASSSVYGGLLSNLPRNIYTWVNPSWFSDAPSVTGTGWLIYLASSYESSTVGTQIWFNPAYNYLFVRKNSNSGWSAWNAMTDTELTASGIAADAKAVGDAIAALSGKAVQPAFIIQHNNLHGCTNANTLTPNRVYAILGDVTSSDLSNLPSAAYGATSYLMYYTSTTTNSNGVQLLHNAENTWFRTVDGNGSGSWVLLTGAMRPANAIVSSSNYTTYFSDNKFLPNKTYAINSSVTAEMIPGLPAYGETAYMMYHTCTPTRVQGVQLYHTADHTWFRVVNSNGNGAWMKLANLTPDMTIKDYFVSTCVFKPITLTSGKGLFIFGDSITTDAHSGFTWGSIVATKTGCTEHNYGVSGSAFVSWSAHSHTIMEQINGVASADWASCDVAIVAAGTNDQKTEAAASDLRTAVQDIIDEIKENAPNAKIVFITPIRREGSSNNGLPMIAGAICNVALANECSVINGFDFPIPTHTDSWVAELTDSDGLHPGTAGNKIYAQCVMNALL